MCNLICLLSLFVAAVFGIVVYGPGGMDASAQTTWINTAFWGIIIVGALPATIQMAVMYVRDFQAWIGITASPFQRLGLEPRKSR